MIRTVIADPLIHCLGRGYNSAVMASLLCRRWCYILIFICAAVLGVRVVFGCQKTSRVDIVCCIKGYVRLG